MSKDQTFAEQALIDRGWDPKEILSEPILPKFRIDLFGALGELEPLQTYWTFGSWHVEGDFLIIWDEASIRTAVRIPLVITRITTTEQGRHEIKDMNEEPEDDTRDSTVSSDTAETVDSTESSSDVERSEDVEAA